MEFTELQDLFVQILVDLELNTEVIAAILTILRTDDQMAELVDFIEINPSATPDELFQRSVEIAGLADEEF